MKLKKGALLLSKEDNWPPQFHMNSHIQTLEHVNCISKCVVLCTYDNTHFYIHINSIMAIVEHQTECIEAC